MQRKSSALQSIVIGVLTIHALFLYFLWTQGHSSKKVSHQTKSIQTHFLTVEVPKKALPTKQKATSQIRSTTSEPKARVAQKVKVDKKKEVLPTSKKEKMPPPKKIEPSLEIASKTEVPVQPSLPISSRGYQDQLRAFLYSHIKMPRAGEVFLAVKVNQNGKILAIEIKEASDSEILHVIKEQIAKIDLPPLSHEFAGQKEHTFIFNFY